jgi:O-glycosyl hydrolase
LLLLNLDAWAATVSVTIDGSQTNQVIDGFGVNANYYNWSSNQMAPVIDALVDDAGMTIFRVIMNNGWEATNDNDDPNVMNWDYYNALYSGPEFEKLWGLIAYLNHKGITNGVMLNFQGPGPDWMGYDSLDYGYEDEWAEMVASLVVYARKTRHLQFTLVAPNNEPDSGSEGIVMTPDQYAAGLHKLALDLDANGLSDVRLVGPDLSSGEGTTFMPEMLADSTVMAKLAHFGIHSYSGYGGDTPLVYDFVQQTDYSDRKLWVTEYNVWCPVCEYGDQGTNDWDYFVGTADYLLNHLDSGASAGLVWEGYDSYYPHHSRWSFWGLLGVDDPNAVSLTYTPRKNFFTLAQIAKFVRPGAVRLGVDGLDDPFELLAFYHSNLGQLTLTGINTDGNPASLSGTLQGLPAISSLEFYYTSSNTNLCHSAPISVSNGTFSLTVPGNAVFTLTGFDPALTTLSVLITNPAAGSTFTAPANIPIQVSATTTTGTLSAVSFFADTNNIGICTNEPFSMVWSNVPPGNYDLIAWATNSLGTSRVSPVSTVTVVGPIAQISIVPTNATVGPLATQQFVAVASDALGGVLVPQPSFAWSVTGGGAIDSNGLFSASGNIAGPFTLMTSNSGIIGTTVFQVNTNLAPSGFGFTWYTLATSADNSPRSPAPEINDGDLQTEVHLLPSGEDTFNAYEAAGVVWPSPETLGRVVYVNGYFNDNADGVFADEFKLQFASDGTNWVDAGPEWTLSPPYAYNSPDAGGVSYIFSGGVVSTAGVRCVGRVHTSQAAAPPNSWVDFVIEVQAFPPPTPILPPPVLRARSELGNVAVYWSGSATNYVLESTTNLSPAATWSPVTNAPQLVGMEERVLIPPSVARLFFRLRLP